MLIYLDIKIPHLKIAHLGGNLEVGNIKSQACHLNFGHWLWRGYLIGQTLLNTTDHFSQNNTTCLFFTTTATRWRSPACLWESSWLSSRRRALKEKKLFVKYVSNLFDGVLLVVISNKLMWYNYGRHFRIAVENWQEMCVKESLYDDK